MKPAQLATILAATVFASRALAADVAYQLETLPLATIEDPVSVQPLTVAFEDRSWATPGAEDAKDYDVGCGNTGRDRFPRRGIFDKVPDPIWHDSEQLWPLTQAMWGRGEFYRQPLRFHLEPAGGHLLSSIRYQR